MTQDGLLRHRTSRAAAASSLCLFAGMAGVGSAHAQAQVDTSPAQKTAPTSRDKAGDILVKKGYSQMTGLEAADGRWTGRGMLDNQAYRFQVDPHNGAVTQVAIEAGSEAGSGSASRD